MPFQLQDVSLIHPSTLFNCIPLYPGIALAVTSGLLIQQLTKKPNS